MRSGNKTKKAEEIRELIISTAMRRFIHFGISKTKMDEIANELSLSKPALYYYFPDKQHLALGVVSRLFSEYYHSVKSGIKPGLSLEESLSRMIDLRIASFIKYLMLNISAKAPEIIDSADMRKLLKDFKKEETRLFIELVKKSGDMFQKRGEAVQEFIELYLDSLNGLSYAFAGDIGHDVKSNNKIAKKWVFKQKSLSAILIKGAIELHNNHSPSKQ